MCVIFYYACLSNATFCSQMKIGNYSKYLSSKKSQATEKISSQLSIKNVEIGNSSSCPCSNKAACYSLNPFFPELQNRACEPPTSIIVFMCAHLDNQAKKPVFGWEIFQQQEEIVVWALSKPASEKLFFLCSFASLPQHRHHFLTHGR